MAGEQSEPGEINKKVDDREIVSSNTIRQLREELELTLSRLEANREEFDRAKQELRATNRELQSANEKYRLMAEKLETSKQRLQSLNDTLKNVNADLKAEVDGLSRANNDLQNLMELTRTGALFLDHQLSIRYFTPAVSELFTVQAVDEGRAFSDFSQRFDCPDFSHDAEAALRSLSVIERELMSEGRWLLARLGPYRTRDGRIDGAVCAFADITERVKTAQALKSHEAHLRLLLSELSHRVKNTLAVVQAMARLSLRRDEPKDEALEAFTNRLSALSASHDLLVKSEWRGAMLKDLTEKQLVPFAIESGRIEIGGPNIFLPPDLVTPISLVVHELAANALKYGAFSTEGGTLKVDWGFKGDEALQEFKFCWRESGGPPVKPPSKQGFGSYLIQNGLPDATVELDFNPRGLLYSVTLPAKSVRNE